MDMSDNIEKTWGDLWTKEMKKKRREWNLDDITELLKYILLYIQ